MHARRAKSSNAGRAVARAMISDVPFRGPSLKRRGVKSASLELIAFIRSETSRIGWFSQAIRNSRWIGTSVDRTLRS